METPRPPQPLPTLLSQALVAFIIELDNEFEHRMPHRTSNHGATEGSRGGPWLVSAAMWSSCLRFVPEAGITLSELERLARTQTNLAGMQRWGYIIVESGHTGARAQRPRPDTVIRPTVRGRQAQQVWQPLFGLIEERWRDRFGGTALDQLRAALATVAGQLDPSLPDCLPILGYGLFSHPLEPARKLPASTEHDDLSHLSLDALLARVLLAFAIEFERDAALSLAIYADTLRVLDVRGVRPRDLPLRGGVSPEATSMALGILRKQHLAAEEPDPTASRGKVIRLTEKGRAAQDACRERLRRIEDRWHSDYGEHAILNLRAALEPLVGDGTAPSSSLFRGLEPYPNGWRAAVRRPVTLPHYPMVLHRGGFPDGS